MKRVILAIIICIFLIIPVNTKAISCIKGKYEASITLSKDKLYVGEELNFNINSNTFYNTEYKSDNDDIIKIENNTIKTLMSGSTTINITINFIEKGEVKDSCTTSIPITIIEPTVSLKELNIEEYDLKDSFKSNLYNYEITLPYEIDVIHIKGIPLSENSKISGTGEKTLNVGLNEFKIIVEEGKESLTYTLSIFREEGSKDNTLKSLIIDGYLLNPKFTNSNYNYHLEVGKDVNDILIKATPNDINAKVKGTGRFDLTTGKNTFLIVVTAQNGKEATYQIEVIKNKGSSTLKNITIEGYTLDTPFQSDKYTYYLTVKPKVESIEIKPEADLNDQIEILSDGTLNYGENEIIIRVTSTDKTSTTYKLIITRLQEENNQILFKKILLYVFIVLIIIVIILISIFIKVNNKRQTKIKKLKRGSELNVW